MYKKVLTFFFFEKFVDICYNLVIKGLVLDFKFNTGFFLGGLL